MLDFKKLNDPVERARVRAQIDAEQAEIERIEAAHKARVDTLMDRYEELTEKERSFVTSCRTRLLTYRGLTDPQAKWLTDIAKRFGA